MFFSYDLIKIWWEHKGSNLGPSPCKGGALPLSYTPTTNGPARNRTPIARINPCVLPIDDRAKLAVYIKDLPRSLWWSWRGSNPRQSRCKRGALPTELQPPYNLNIPGGTYRSQNKQFKLVLRIMEESERFELSEACTSTDFKSVSFDHSDNSPHMAAPPGLEPRTR